MNKEVRFVKKLKKFIASVFLVLVVVLLGGCGQTGGKTGQGTATQKEITVSAAMSLKDALEQIKGDYTNGHPDIKINLNMGASGPLQKQIEEGAPVDLFISAGVKQMDQLAEKGLIDPATRINLLGNELVLITGKDNQAIKDFPDLAGPVVKKIAIGMPETVPVGKYTRETLENLKLWDELQPKLVPAKDVRQVLTYVESNNVDAGFVYRSDALRGKRIKVALTVPDNLHKPILYPAAVLKNARKKDAARDFLNYMASPQGMAVFEKYGFRVGKR